MEAKSKGETERRVSICDPSLELFSTVNRVETNRVSS